MTVYKTKQWDGSLLDLSGVFAQSTAVAGSPATNAETTVANLTLPGGAQIVTGVLLLAIAEFTVGTSGVSALFKIKRGSTIIHSTGALTAVAANLMQTVAFGIDTAAADGQAYTATLTIGSGAAQSAVSAVTFAALMI